MNPRSGWKQFGTVHNPRQHLKVSPRAPKAALLVIPIKIVPAIATNVLCQTNAPPISNTQQNNVSPVIPNALPRSNHVFALNLTASISHHSTKIFKRQNRKCPVAAQNTEINYSSLDNNQEHKVELSVDPDEPNIPNVPLCQQFRPNVSFGVLHSTSNRSTKLLLLVTCRQTDKQTSYNKLLMFYQKSQKFRPV